MAYLPTCEIFQDAFSDNISFDVLPVRNSTKSHLLKLIDAYYGGHEADAETWFEIAGMIKLMFTQHFMETVFPRPQYMQLYGATEICVFPMITSSDRVVSNAFTNTMTAIILAVLMCNLSVIVCTKIYKLSPIPIKKTDYPSRLVHINANICVFSFFPITLLSVIHNMGLLDISYIYTLSVLL